MGLKSVYDLLASRARETPGGSAVLAPGCHPLTYGHLHTQIRYVGSVLQTVGVERNDRVAVLCPWGLTQPWRVWGSHPSPRVHLWIRAAVPTNFEHTFLNCTQRPS